jgi:hypothetical protein
MADGATFVTGGWRGHVASPGTGPSQPAPASPPSRPDPASLEATWPPHLADGCGRVGLAAALGPESGRPATSLRGTAARPGGAW